MKTVLVKAICLSILFSCICLSARAEYDFQVNGLYYRIVSFEDRTCACVDERNTVDYAQPSKYSGNIVIPDTVSFGERVFKVTEIGANAFFMSSITSVKLGVNIEVIRKMAFELCDKLVRVEMEDGVTKIESYAFSGCRKLKYLKLSNSIQGIDYRAFEGCDYFSGTFSIPSSCNYLGDEALPESGDYTVIIKDGSTPLSIGEFALGRAGGKNLYVGRKLISAYHCVGVYEYDNVLFGDNVTSMPECVRVYSDAGKIQTLVIGESVKIVPKIGMFEINTIRCRSMIPPKATLFLDSVYLNATLYVPKGSLEAYQSADIWKDFWTIKEIEMM